MRGVAGVVLGVGRRRLQPSDGGSVLHTEDGWGFDAQNGDLVHGTAQPILSDEHSCLRGLSDAEGSHCSGEQLDQKWEGQRGAVEGDRIGMALDCDAGTLAVFRNGERLGMMVPEGLRAVGSASVTMAVKASPVAWACCALFLTLARAW